MTAVRATVVLSTYEQPDLLALALRGYERQSTRDFEIVIGDDGSGEATREVIERARARLAVPLHHVWQPDDGFHKAKAVNRAVLASEGALLVFSDGDCIPSRTFVEEHLAAARPRGFTVGGHVRLSAEESRSLVPADVDRGALEGSESWGVRAGLWTTHVKSLVYVAVRRRRRPRLYGLNFSVGRASFVFLNGFDQTYHNSAKDDSDLRNRMRLAGMRPRSLWHRARVYHLDHPPNEARIGWKGARAYYGRADLAVRAPVGLTELASEVEAQECAAP